MRIILFVLLFYQLHAGDYFSHHKQDKYVYEHYFPNKKDGFFVELGAYDGVTISNTLFFERYLGWKGICIEPMVEAFNKLIYNRNCICVNECISNTSEPKDFYQIQVEKELKEKNIKARWPEMFSGFEQNFHPKQRVKIANRIRPEHVSTKHIVLNPITLQKVFDDLQVIHVDFLSLDTEGNELDILQSIDFNICTISVILVENNYKEPFIRDFLEEKGYVFDKRISFDEVYFHPDLIDKL